jgi:recombination DNA repair RAD52 pathway protein
MKSERLKKLETELYDLEQWQKLGLVPKKDIQKHQEEINLIREKIREERERLRFLKESGEMEEYIVPKKTPARVSYADNPTIPDMDLQDDDLDNMEVTMETVAMTADSTTSSEAKDEDGSDDYTRTDEEDPFSDKNRWRRGILDADPDSDQW